MKITIIGSSGGGKSTLARKISECFSMSRLEIDRLWFKHNGHLHLKSCTPEQKEEINQKILAEVQAFLENNQNWVVDGTYSKIQPVIAEQADMVVLIQRPLVQRMYSHIARVIRGKDRHPEVTTLQDLSFIKTLFTRWRKGEDSKLVDFVKQYQTKLIILKNFKEIDAYFETLKT